MSAEGAWKSLNRVNEQKFLPNDSILLEGSVLPGNYYLEMVWKKGMPIVIGAFGKGVPPFIAGSVSVKVWRKLSEKDIWWSPASVNPVWIWLVKKDGTVEWGERKENKEQLIAQNDWCWEDGVPVFFLDRDPESTGSIEAAAVDYCLVLQGHYNISVSKISKSPLLPNEGYGALKVVPIG